MCPMCDDVDETVELIVSIPAGERRRCLGLNGVLGELCSKPEASLKY